MNDLPINRQATPDNNQRLKNTAPCESCDPCGKRSCLFADAPLPPSMPDNAGDELENKTPPEQDETAASTAAGTPKAEAEDATETKSGLSAFAAECEILCLAYKKLAGVLHSPNSAETAPALRGLLELLDQHRTASLNIGVWAAIIKDKQGKAALIKDVIDKMTPFLRRFPAKARHFGDPPLSRLMEAKRLAAKADSRLFALQNQALMLDFNRKTARRRIAEASNILRQDRKLTGIIADPATNSDAEIKEWIAVLKKRAWYSFLLPSFERAKRAYEQISLRREFKAEEAVADLEELFALRSAKENFWHLETLKPMFGEHFKGIYTKFEDFSLLMDFCDKVDGRFNKPEEQGLALILKRGRLEVFAALPDLPEVGFSFRAILSRYRHFIEEIEQKKSAAREVRKLSAVLVNPQSLTKKGLEAIIAAHEKYLAKKQALYADKALVDALRRRLENAGQPLNSHCAFADLPESGGSID